MLTKRIISASMVLLSLSSLAQDVKVDFVTNSIVRIQWAHDGNIEANNTGACVYKPEDVKVATKKTKQQITYSSQELKVVVDRKTQSVSFFNARTGKVLLSENPAKPYGFEPVVQERIIYDEKSAHTEYTANGQVTVKDVVRRDTIGTSTRYVVNFVHQNEKAMYGLGSQMEDYMNLIGKTVYLTQHNLKTHVPMLNTTAGYGLMFDAGCAMKFVSDTLKNEFSMQLEAAREIDYYFIKGERMDDVVGGYRYLTGSVSMMPRYVFGYTQSKERYCSSDEIVGVLKKYRDLRIPIDMIVQDWNYWPQGWGYMKMDPKYYPSPKALADSVHALGAKLMVSIWPNPQWCPEAEDFKARGMMLEHDVYDVFNPEARRHYWKYANDEFFSQGFDAWWCDSSEPLDGDWNQLPEPRNGKPYSWDDHERRWQLNKDVLSDALGAERSSLYSLYHSMGIYENQRLADSTKRVVNLTRSSFLGQQRYGTIVWNGDTHASWESFRQQIPSGLNYMATGNPYWTVDVGSFFTKNDGRRWFYKGDFQNGVKDPKYQEYYVRMFQWATFLPMLRSHGSDTPREIWQFEEPYFSAIKECIQMRYMLLPYNYSLAYRQSAGNYTMARPLAFDYPGDENVLDIKDQYMFGDFMVCPVTMPRDEMPRDGYKLYLPKGDKWFLWNFDEGQKVLDGGQWLISDRPNRSELPMFVRGGSILVTTHVARNNTDELSGKPLEITVVAGKDAEFALYEDSGDGYQYQKGECSIIKIRWNDAAKILTIGDRQGTFPGMAIERHISVKLCYEDENHKSKFNRMPRVTYNGTLLELKF